MQQLSQPHTQPASMSTSTCARSNCSTRVALLTFFNSARYSALGIKLVLGSCSLPPRSADAASSSPLPPSRCPLCRVAGGEVSSCVKSIATLSAPQSLDERCCSLRGSSFLRKHRISCDFSRLRVEKPPLLPAPPRELVGCPFFSGTSSRGSPGAHPLPYVAGAAGVAGAGRRLGLKKLLISMPVLHKPPC